VHRDPSTRFRDRFRAALRDAMAVRDSVSVAALRSVLGAIDNAEAVDAVPAVPVGESTIAGAVLGLGAGDVPRRQLSETELRQVVQREVEERAAVAEQYDRVGRPDRAERLRAEAAVLAGHLPGR
jgi:uncharacterized protein YqeY